MYCIASAASKATMGGITDGRRQHAMTDRFQVMAVYQATALFPFNEYPDIETSRSQFMKLHTVRTYKSAEHLAREDQLAWRLPRLRPMLSCWMRMLSR